MHAVHVIFYVHRVSRHSVQHTAGTLWHKLCLFSLLCCQAAEGIICNGAGQIVCTLATNCTVP